MRLLWLVPYLPAPNFGAGTRVYNLIEALSTHHDIDLIASTSECEQDAVSVLQRLCCSLDIVPTTPISTWHKRWLQLRSLVTGRPAQHLIVHSAQMQERIDAAVLRTQYDAILLEHSFMSCYSLPAETPLIVDQHNVESEILLRASQYERSLIRRGYNRLEYRKYLKTETEICGRAQLVLATSSRDADTMQSWKDVRHPYVVPNGVDCAYFYVPTKIIEKPTSLIFTGTMHYAPNVDAMLYFVREIWPLITSKLPLATLTIVGADPTWEIVQLGRLPGIAVTGTVLDIRTYLAQSQVVVVPLRFGGGTRLKILEAMAMGRAIVTTSLGCEGLDVKNGAHLMVEDDPVTFAARVVELLDQPAHRTALGTAGRALVEHKYDWRTLGAHLNRNLLQLLGQHSATPGSNEATPDFT